MVGLPAHTDIMQTRKLLITEQITLHKLSTLLEGQLETQVVQSQATVEHQSPREQQDL